MPSNRHVHRDSARRSLEIVLFAEFPMFAKSKAPHLEYTSRAVKTCLVIGETGKLLKELDPKRRLAPELVSRCTKPMQEMLAEVPFESLKQWSEMPAT